MRPLVQDRPGILVVEDERLTAADLEASLTGLGYHVMASVASGEEALAFANDLRPSVVIMDVRLRGALNGIETGERIQRQWSIPVLYVTGYAGDAHQRGYPWILKPFSTRALRNALEELLCAGSLTSSSNEGSGVRALSGKVGEV